MRINDEHRIAGGHFENVIAWRGCARVSLHGHVMHVVRLRKVSHGLAITRIRNTGTVGDL